MTLLILLHSWYKRRELGTRVGVFFSSATIAGAFSRWPELVYARAAHSCSPFVGGLLAAAIQNMDGVGGKPGWAWIFILEGLVTVLCAMASFFILSDFPDTAKFLTETERKSASSSNLAAKRFQLFMSCRCLGCASAPG